MTARGPRYPNQKRTLKRRVVLLFAVLLVLGSGAAVYNMLQNSRSLQEIAAGRQPQAPAGDSASAAPASPAEFSLPPVPLPATPHHAAKQELPPPVPFEAHPKTASSPALEPLELLPAAAKAEAPFAGATPGDIAQQLRTRFAGRAPRLWGERMEGITSRLNLPDRAEGRRVVALTFDACGGRKGASYDAELIALLREYNIPATLFVTSLWIRNNRETLQELAADPLFEIAAHGSRHRPCSVNGRSVYDIKGTASMDELVAEVEGNVRDVEAVTGIRPRWFRSGTAYYDDVAVDAIHTLGLGIAGYSITGDEGATLPARRVAAKTLGAKHGDILLFHMNRPKSGTREGLRQALPQLIEQGTVFIRLSDIPSPP